MCARSMPEFSSSGQSLTPVARLSDKEWFDRNEQREGIRRAWDDFFGEWDMS